ncbi:RNA polymerase-associated protein RapA (plasmid) [Mesorhizobium loti]|nr:RNA polymerase-associated protein RapA [Mesorhizobium loti]
MRAGRVARDGRAGMAFAAIVLITDVATARLAGASHFGGFVMAMISTIVHELLGMFADEESPALADPEIWEAG